MALFGALNVRFLRLRHGLPSHDTLQPAVPGETTWFALAARPCAVRGLPHPPYATLGRVARTRKAGTRTSTGTVCCLLSTALSDARFGEAARAHGSLENGLYRVLDVVMDGDQARNHKDHGPRNLALLRRLALNLAKLEGSRESLKGKLYRAALSGTFLTCLLAQSGKT